jgi:hypothetical protein
VIRTGSRADASTVTTELEMRLDDWQRPSTKRRAWRAVNHQLEVDVTVLKLREINLIKAGLKLACEIGRVFRADPE